VKSSTKRIGLAELWDAARSSFGFLPGLAMLLGLVAGFGLPTLDKQLGITMPALSFDGQDAARSLLETIATSVVAVAGLSFSVTVVAFTLASSQLSPRVLRSFRRDRLSQMTLAAMLGTFVYSLVVLVRLGISEQSAEPPNLAVSVAIVAAVASFALFSVFIAHIVSMLQPSSLIEAIHNDARDALAKRYPCGPGEPADAIAASVAAADLRSGGARRLTVHAAADESGYLNAVDTGGLIDAACGVDGLVEQLHPIGSWILPGQALARVRFDGFAATRRELDEDDLAATIRSCFRLGNQRTDIQDASFPIRQLADIALRGLSPGINDPTTAQNAMEQMTSILVDFARSDGCSSIRVDENETPRFVAVAPNLDSLVRVGFGEIRIRSGEQPSFSGRMVELLGHLRDVATSEGESTAEIDRQQRLLLVGLGLDGPLEEEVETVKGEASPFAAGA
jgi:uncharacterized membrane protein